MEQSTREFLSAIDEELLIYVKPLDDKAFVSTKTLKYLTEADLDFAKPAHRYLILDHTRKLKENQE